MDKFLLKSNFAIQTSNVNRPVSSDEIYEYDFQSIWSNNYIDYFMNKRIGVYFINIFKKNIIEDYESSTLKLKGDYNMFGLGLYFLINDRLELKFGSDKYKELYKSVFSIKYKMNKITANLNVENFMLDYIHNNSWNCCQKEN